MSLNLIPDDILLNLNRTEQGRGDILSRMDMDSLPNELLLNIFRYCDSPTLWNLMLISPRHAALMKNNITRVRISLPVSDLLIEFLFNEIRLNRIIGEEDPLRLKNGADSTELKKSKCFLYSDSVAAELFDHIWYMEPLRTNIIIHNEQYRDVLDKMPKSWLARTTKINITSLLDQFNIEKLRSQLPRYTSLNLSLLDDHYDVNQMLRHMQSVQEIIIGSSICNDETLDLLIEKSKKDSTGLRRFTAYCNFNDFTVEKLIYFLQNAKFDSTCTLSLGNVRGKKSEFDQFLRDEKAEERNIDESNYFFNLFNCHFFVSISAFI